MYLFSKQIHSNKMSENISVVEVDKWLNFQLICKPEQSGKTFVMIRHIIKDLTEPIDGKEIVNFILCDNNLLLTKQTSARVEKDLKEHVHDGVVYIELSSHARTEYHDNESVFHAIIAKNVRNIICCTNGTRMNDIFELIKDINASLFTAGKFHFNIWLDEADKFIKFIDSTLRPIVEKHPNVNVKLITATPQPLFTKYKYMNVLPIENTTSESYHGWADNNVRIIEKDVGCLEFVDHILCNVAQDNITPGTKWFIPGKSIKKSHEAIKTLCVEKGMAVLCVNGDGLKLTLPDTLECITFKKNDEFNRKIQEIYCEYKLHRFALVITGYICIGRGITIMSEDFMIDYAILSHYSDKNEASQLAGRVKGNIKGFKNYTPEKPPMIFTTEDFDKVAIEWEGKSKALAKLAFEKEQKGETTVIDVNDFKTCDKPFKYICHEVLFPSFEKAKDFLRTKERAMTKEGEKKCKVIDTKQSAIHQCEGYFVTSKLLKAGKAVSDLTKEDRITLEQSKTILPSTHITSTKTGSRYLILPIYDNEQSPPTSVKFQVRYIKFD
jgi:hypothetical protein